MRHKTKHSYTVFNFLNKALQYTCILSNSTLNLMSNFFKITKRLFSSKKHYNYVIAGGGPVGTSIALHLAKLGHTNILVLEKDFGYKSASAMLSAGGIRQQFSVEENIKMSIYGANFIKNMQDLAVDDEIPDIQFHENGYLFLGGSKSKHILETNQCKQVESGADWIHLLDSPALKAKFPWLNMDSIDVGSFGAKNEGYFDPWLLVAAMKRKAVSLGVEYLEGKVVGGKLQPVSTGSKSYNLTSVNVVGTKSGHEHSFSAGQFVNSAGAWSGRLVDDIASSLVSPRGIRAVPVRPRKRCIFAVHCPGTTATEEFPLPPCTTPLVVDPSGVYFRPEGKKPGRFITGVSPAEESDRDVAPEEESRALESADHALFEEVIWPALYERVPAFAELKVTASWAGFYDYNSLDQNAIIGFHSEIRNLLLCTGFSGHGLQQAPAAGRAAAELLTNDNKFSTLDLSRFSFERVVDNKPIFETGIV